jgi:hypothetical protein
MDPGSARRPLFGSSGWWAFCIAVAVAGIGFLVERYVWQPGGIALLIIGVGGMAVFRGVRDWHHPWRSL